MQTPTRRRRIRNAGIVGISALALLGAACSSDSETSTSDAPTTMAPTTDAPMTEEPMSDESMSDESAMMLEPTGDGCAAVPTDGEGSFGGMADDPAATAASNNPALSTLVAAVTEADLVDTLNGEGPFTIFAPANSAFEAIPAADLDAVLADTELLTSILTYHVVAGEKMSSADLIEAGTVTTVNGADLTITEVDGTLTVNDTPTVCMDVPTANATVHIISGVLMPS